MLSNPFENCLTSIAPIDVGAQMIIRGLRACGLILNMNYPKVE